MKRGVSFALIALALVAGACSSGGPKGAQTYNIQADAASAAGKNFQFSAFYPSTIKARPGDTITISNGGSVAPHSVSFGVKPDRSDSPPLVTATGENPAIFGPCVTQEAASPKWTKCPAGAAKAADYTGKGYWNGFMVPKGTPPQAGSQSVTLKLSSSIAPGTYTFQCLLHAPMKATLEVVDKDSDRKTPADLTTEVKDAVSAAQAQADKIANPTLGAGEVAAGFSSANIAVNRFYPMDMTVKAGTKVTWKDFSDFEPHTVTFGYPPPTNGPGPFFAPGGIASGGSYDSATAKANSGIFGGDIPGKKEFSLVFPAKGKYMYVCMLHPGMAGTITVN
jgi:plastocyanin